MRPPTEELSVVIVNPDVKVWEGKAESVSSENSTGPFDILPQHSNFVTIVRNKPITIREATGKKQTITYKSAVLVVKDDLVMIYTDI
jgi:F0F1-type ATP synthase epsilon subunit